jgi:hypothetical protein
MRMPTRTRETTLGDLVVAAFESARVTTSSRRLASRLAARTVEAQLRRARRADLIRELSQGGSPLCEPVAAAG